MASSLGLRAYRAMICLLPGRFRRRFGPEMEEVLRLRLDEARTPVARAWVWVRAALDVGRVAAHEWTLATTTTDEARRRRMDARLHDLHGAARALARSPGLSIGVTATLALGIGASTATFSVVRAVMLKPLTYAEPERLVVVWPEQNFNAAMVRELVASVPALTSASGISGWELTLTGEGEPLRVEGARVSPGHLRMLGVRPMLGRDFLDGEGLPGDDAVAIVSHGLWVRAFGADPGVVGRSVRLATNDHPARTVVGVLPPDFRPVEGDPEVWIPLVLAPSRTVEADSSWYVNARVARLAPGVTVSRAAEEVRAFAREMRRRMPQTIDRETVERAGVESLRRHMAGSLAPVLWVALGAVSLVLLIACANVTNLLLVRGEARGADLAIRAALGARRARLVRMLLAESALLGLLGGAFGVALAHGLARGVVALAPPGFPRVDEIAIDRWVLGFALAATAAATLIAGLVPSLRAGRTDARATLAGAGRSRSAARATRLTSGLVTAQVALAVVVAVGSGLTLRSLERLTSEDPGLRGEGVIVFRASPPEGRYPDGLAFRRYYDEVLERVGALPAVERASAIHLLPGTLSNWSFPTFVEGVPIASDEPIPTVNFRVVRPGYFETVRTSLLGGRTLGPADGEGAERVVVVNRAFVERFWPGEEALGREARIMSTESAPYRVVGVVGDVRQHGLGREPRPEMYFTHAHIGWNVTFWIVARMRDEGRPLEHAPALREAVWSVDPDVPIDGLDELARVIDRSAATTRFVAAVLGSFGALALLLSAVGVFGVTAYSVGRRGPEFGVRVALGSPRAAVLRTALAGSLGAVLTGLALGLGAAAFSTDLLASALYGVEPSDPATFTGVAAVLLAVALAAALLPAWRASRVDPVRVLNAE